MSIKNIYTFIILIFLFVSPCFATNYYVKDGGTSSACTTWTDACDQLSTAENLAARGDTVYVADGTYTGATFNTPTSGTTPITIKKSTVADHGTETGYVEADHNGTATFTSNITFSTGYWVFDGITGGGPGSWSTGHGFIIAFEASTNAQAMAYITAGNITISHTYFNNTYNATHCSSGISGYSQVNPNVQIRYCYFTDFLGTVASIGYEADNWIIEYNFFAENYSSVTNPSCHGNLIATRGTDDLTVRYNRFQDGIGTGYITAMNGGTGTDEADEVLAENWYIHGNLFRGTKEVNSSNTIIYLNYTSTQRQAAKNWYIYNNDFVGLTNSSTYNGTKPVFIEHDLGGIVFKNNIVYDCETPIMLYSVDSAITHDYNWYTGAAPAGHGANCIENQAGNPFTNSAGGDYTLVAALTGDSSIGATYNKDWTTATRGEDAVWDMGALEYVEGGAPPDTDTPDITTIVIDSTGTVLTITLDEDVTVVTGGGFTLACTNAIGEGLSYVSELAGVLTYNITGVAIDDDDTCTLDYASTGGIVDAALNALETIGDPVAVDNQSTNTPEATSYTVSVSVGEGCSLSPARHQTIETGATASITCTPSANYQCITWTGTCSGSGTTSWSATITGDCTATQPCQKIASDATIGSGCAITVGSGPAIRVY